MFYSYVLYSESSNIYYKGSTQNIEDRVDKHNRGEVNYTSKHMPWILFLHEEFNSRSEAMKREKWYKSGVGRDWIKNQINKT